MNDRICGTCTHWENSLGYIPLPVPWNMQMSAKKQREAQIERNKDLGQCTLAQFYDDVDYDAPVPAMVISDASGYQATLYTRVDHGCAQWKEKT
jgi:hypothetical protein